MFNLTVNDARDMFSKDVTVRKFKERRRLKEEKLHSKYALEETINIFNKDTVNMELPNQLRSDPPSPTMFIGMVKVKREVLIVHVANEKMLRDEEQHAH